MKNTEILEEMIKSRRSIRKFKDIAILDEDVRRVIEASGFAPSITNYQPWKFIYVKDSFKC
ncbi:MAG: nitroreductase family protein [bacterium]